MSTYYDGCTMRGSGIDAVLTEADAWCPNDECAWEGEIEAYVEDTEGLLLDCPDCGTWLDV